MINVLIVDDEKLAIRRLEIKLSTCENVCVVGTCSDGDAAIKQLETTKANLVLLDIHMPGVGGLDVALEAAKYNIGVIFITAFNHYAVKAFEQQAVDYLLKPVSKPRLELALQRFREKQKNETAIEKINELTSVVMQLRAYTNQEKVPSLNQALWIKDKGQHRKLTLHEIEWVEASGDYVSIHMISGKSYFIRETMQSIEKSLADAGFQRVHRSAIVNFSQIKGLSMRAGNQDLILRSGATIRVARQYKNIIKQRLKTLM